MKYLFLLICNVFMININNYLIININSNSITLKSFSSADNKLLKSEIIKITELTSKRFFVYENDSVYIDYDTKPIVKESLIKYFSEKINVDEEEISTDHFIVTIALIIDRNGTIMNKGFLMECSYDGYKKQIINILDTLNLKFQPAKIDNKDVSVLYYFDLDFSDDEFIKYNSR
jgi:hypothetical protein